MYDIRQFRPTFYLVLLTGCTGFGIAAGAMGLWLLAMAALGLHVWLMRTGRFRPLPRWGANVATVLAFAFFTLQALVSGEPKILVVSGFLILLHVIKLFELRGNRDYAQLLVLNLLLMVAAAISTGALIFGLVLAAYIVLALYCCLLFHLKVEAEHALAAMPIPKEHLNSPTLRQDQMYLSRSMRRFTGFVAVVSLATAAFVFLFFPRGKGGVLGEWQSEQRQPLTGFSDQITFGRLAQIQQSPEVVAHVLVWRDNQPWRAGPLYLRAMTMDQYGGSKTPADRAWTRQLNHLPRPHEVAPDAWTQVSSGGPGRWRQRVSFQLTGQSWLFALRGPVSVLTDQPMLVNYYPWDQAMRVEMIRDPITYEVTCSDNPADDDRESVAITSDADALQQAREFALKSIPGAADSPGLRAEANREIAEKIEAYLLRNYSYALDLSDVKAGRDEDRLMMFLTRTQRGHCEYFAGSMALLCQSLGIPARVVAGFKCDEYSSVGDYFIVRQAHAHAWVEVLTTNGWVRFDPTSGREAPTSTLASWWQGARHLMDYMQFKWSEHVIAYDRGTRAHLLDWMDTALTRSIISGGDLGFRLKQWFRRQEITIVFVLLVAMIGLMLAALVLAVVWFAVQQYRLRRRAARMGIDALPLGDQLRLARQLGFYDALIQILARRGIVRPAHLTPLEFSHSLAHLPGEAYAAIVRLTRLMYRVRFGEAKMPPSRQRMLGNALERLVRALAPTDH